MSGYERFERPSYLDKNKLIRDAQHGFRRGRSCLSNLLEFLDKVSQFVDEGNSVDVVYLDFAKCHTSVCCKS